MGVEKGRSGYILIIGYPPKHQALSLRNMLKTPKDVPGIFSGDDSKKLLCPSLQSFGVPAPGFLQTRLPHHSVAFNYASLEAECSLVSVITVLVPILTFLPCSAY